ncbi:TniB family NTP-binding protein [Streptomyces spectabilis]|uniref:Mrp family chromosome partitioning ATPase n=1 Tax=Streptomyces spectabilis TaxID=68270 RepID=A0A7W8B445_STRST|nr:hypothetical protein [Streptomyces spectabilis]MBB5109968.1 Mrp family chromosome partitioning ATPase [Streptomyces spectabilis]GGV56844.1 hypothetical protein GCM10010245_89870 [Streptomyces spectabilis]
MTPPPDARQETEDVHPLSTKEGWASFVAEETMPPEVLSPAAIQRLSPDQRTAREREREEYQAQLVIGRTPTIQHVTITGRKRILNRRQQSARRRLIVSGPAGTGKTTAITQLGKNYELLARRRGEVGRQALPVVYATAPPAATPKMLAVELDRAVTQQTRRRPSTPATRKAS